MTDRNGAPTRKKSVWPLAIGLPLIAVLAAAAIFFTGQSPEQSAEAPSGEAPSETAESPAPSDEQENGGASGIEHPALGDGDAPVVMVEFSDYQ